MQEYEVEINGLTHTMLLDDDEAERRGAKVVGAKSVEDKAVKPSTTRKK